jgi:hypothetical protein
LSTWNLAKRQNTNISIGWGEQRDEDIEQDNRCWNIPAEIELVDQQARRITKRAPSTDR